MWHTRAWSWSARGWDKGSMSLHAHQNRILTLAARSWQRADGSRIGRPALPTKPGDTLNVSNFTVTNSGHFWEFMSECSGSDFWDISRHITTYHDISREIIRPHLHRVGDTRVAHTRVAHSFSKLEELTHSLRSLHLDCRNHPPLGIFFLGGSIWRVGRNGF